MHGKIVEIHREIQVKIYRKIGRVDRVEQYIMVDPGKYM